MIYYFIEVDLKVSRKQIVIAQVILHSGERLVHKGLSIELAYLIPCAKSYSILCKGSCASNFSNSVPN